MKFFAAYAEKWAQARGPRRTGARTQISGAGPGAEGLFVDLKSMVIDAWSWLNYKPIFSDPTPGMPHRRAFPEAHASWIPPEAERRLAAYKLPPTTTTMPANSPK